MSWVTKRSLVFCFLLLLFTFSVHAATKESQIYEGDTFSVTKGGEISVYDYDLKFTMGSNTSKIYVEDLNSDKFIFVDLNNCERLGHINLCYDRSSGNTIFVRLFSLVPSLAIDMGAERNDLFAGEESTMNITITNEGERTANNTYMEFTIPDEIAVLDVKNAVRVDDKIIWNESLPATQTAVIEITYKPIKTFADLTLSSSVTYDNYFDNLTEEADIDISSKKFIDLIVRTEPKTLFIGNPFKMYVTLLNNHSDEYNISIPEFSVKKKDVPLVQSIEGFVINDDSSSFWSGTLDYNETQEFMIEFLPKKSGRIYIPFEIKANDTTRLLKVVPEFPLDIVSRDIEIYPTLVSGDEYNSSKLYTFDIIIKNLDDQVVFKNINIKAKNKNGISEKTLDELPTMTQKTVKGFTFLTSSTDSSLSETIEIEVTYENSLFEEKSFRRTVNYYVKPFRELSVWNNITKNEDGSYQLTAYVENFGDISAEKIRAEHTLPDNFFIKGQPDGLLEGLEAHSQDLISSFAFTTNANFSSEDYVLKTVYSYDMDNVTRVYTVEENLSAMVLALEVPVTDSFLGKTRESIERIFSSTRIFVLFVISVILMTGSLVSLTLYRRQFTVSGYDGLERKQKSIELRKTKYIQRESKIKTAKAKLDAKIHDLKDFMAKTKKKMEKEIPVIEEKKDGLRIRQEELLSEKKLIDQKIVELKEIEERLLKKNHAYDNEKRELEMHESRLNRRFEDVKSRLNDLTGEFQKLLDAEDIVNKQKEGLNKKELGIIANKQKLIKMGSEKFSEEKISTIQEKVELEHEKNAIQEELFSLTHRKEDISTAQESIKRQKADLEKEQNIFDANKDAVENSLKALQAQSDSIKHILADSKESYIDKEDKKND